MTTTLTKPRQRRLKNKSSRHVNYIECGGECERVFAPSSVVNMPIERDTETGLYFRCRKFYCGTCHHIKYWIERCRPDGSFMFPPEVLIEPGYYRDEKNIAEFLAKHPEADDVRYVEST